MITYDAARSAQVFDWEVVRDFLGLDAGIGCDQGPADYEDNIVGPSVVITVGGGPGLELEYAYDRVLVSVDVAGDQNDPRGAQRLAFAVDQKMIGVDRNTTIGGFPVLSIQRVGGPPDVTDVDDGDRTHLVCGYVWRVQSGARK